LNELIDTAWVLPPYDSVPGPAIVEVFRDANLRPPIASMVTLSLQLTTKLIAAGRYVGLLPRSAVHFSASRSALKILPVELAAQPATVGVVTLKNRTLSPLAKLFIDCAHEIVKPLARAK
jgi:DNA-binding transcriptional LysR family regulator